MNAYQYLGVTQQTAEWALSNKSAFAVFAQSLEEASSTESLRHGVVIAGQLRMAASSDSPLLIIWNPEYSSGTGSELWGFMRLTGTYGILLSNNTVVVFERFLHVVSQRLQNLQLDTVFKHRSHPEIGKSLHTCLAGRGNEAWHASLAYFDGTAKSAQGQIPVVLCLGPSTEQREKMVSVLESEVAKLESLIDSANIAMDASRARPALEENWMKGVRRAFHSPIVSKQDSGGLVAAVPPLSSPIDPVEAPIARTLTFDDWIRHGSPLGENQRKILESQVLHRQPVRITGPAGSGKTLLMQLMAVQLMRESKDSNQSIRAMFVVHNASMHEEVFDRFCELGAEEFLEEKSSQFIEVSTLFEYCRGRVDMGDVSLIDTDAYESKQYQMATIHDCILSICGGKSFSDKDYPLLSQVIGNDDLAALFAMLLVWEIGIAIKGRGVSENRKLYVESSRPLSRFHGVMTQTERNLVFDIFEQYRYQVFEKQELLDSDDLVISAFQTLRAPLWQMQRRKLGYDYVFVDEAQLFNENERRLFSFLTNTKKQFVPIVLALDEAQEFRGMGSAGFALLGIPSMSEEKLDGVFRCTPKILELCFHIIQQTTDLFGADFPDFTKETVSLVPDNHKLAEKPLLVTGGEGWNIGKYVIGRAEKMRHANLRQVAVVIHAERYWSTVKAAAEKYARTRVVELVKRGDPINSNSPVIVLSRPDAIGGQEFDGVIAVGLEEGLVPPSVGGHTGLGAALEQQALREMYLSFSRARYRVEVCNAVRSTPTALLASAIKSKLIGLA